MQTDALAGVLIQLLGGFSIVFEGREITEATFERRSAAALVQLLACSDRRRMHREQVLESLWPNVGAQTSSGRLYKAASLARKAIGSSEAITLRDEVVSLFPDELFAPVAVDSDTVLRADLGDRVAVDGALTMFSGDLLPDSPYDEWLDGPRRRLERRRMELLEAGERWNEIVRLDPTNEPAYLQLMERAVARGDWSTALRTFESLAEALDREFGVAPSNAATELANSARVAAPSVSSQSGMVGRGDELQQLTKLVAKNRVVSIVGPGGAGKTRLADYFATSFNAAGTHTARVCSLGKISSSDSVAAEALVALGLDHHDDATSAESLVRSLRDVAGLVVFDNAEHVLDGVIDTVSDLLNHCPLMKILLTSREPLGLAEENVLRLGPLDRASAIDLFVLAAAQQGRDLTNLGEADRTSVDRICARLDDLPLALQLAASRTRTLDLASVEELISDRFRHIRDPDSQDNGNHQQTLSDSIRWSVDALSPALRLTLSSLSAMANTFNAQSAIELLSLHGLAPATSVEQLDELVRRSLLMTTRGRDAAVSYRLLESVRLFVRRHIADEPDFADRHLDYVIQRMRHSDSMMGATSDQALGRIRSDWDDLRLALDTAIDQDDAGAQHALLGACTQFLNLTHCFEVLEWCERSTVLEGRKVTSVEHARSLAAWACQLAQRGDGERATRVVAPAIAAFPTDPAVLWGTAYGPWTVGDMAETRYWLERLHSLGEVKSTMARTGSLLWLSMLDFSVGRDISTFAHELGVLAVSGDPVVHAESLLVSGMAAILTDPAEALRLLDESIHVGDSIDVGLIAATARSVRSLAATLIGSPEQALRSALDCLEWTADHGMWAWALASLPVVAGSLERNGRADMAVTLLSAKEASGYGGFGAEAAVTQVNGLRIRFADQFEGWWSVGQNLDTPSACKLAIQAIKAELASV